MADNKQNTPCLEPQKPFRPLKTRWPELAGMKAEDAEKKIKEDMPGAMVDVLHYDSPVTLDYKTNRVRLFVDLTQVVVIEPTIG